MSWPPSVPSGQRVLVTTPIARSPSSAGPSPAGSPPPSPTRAGGEGFPTEVEALDAVIVAAGELRHVLGEHRRALDKLAGDLEQLTAHRVNLTSRDAEAAEAIAEAVARRAGHMSAEHELATLRQALGENVDTVLAELRLVGARIERLDHDLLPAAEAAYTEAVRIQATANVVLRGASDAEVGASAMIGSHGCQPWRMSAGDYENTLGRLALIVGELPLLAGPPVPAVWDAELAPAMAMARRAIHEELVLDDLLNDMGARAPSKMKSF